MGDRLAVLESQIPGLSTGDRATVPEVDVKLRVRNDDSSLARSEEHVLGVSSEMRIAHGAVCARCRAPSGGSP